MLTLVPPEGEKDAKICIIGEAPSWQEIKDLKPFAGPSGGVLENCLHQAGFIRSECYITNVFKFQIKKGKDNLIKTPSGELLWHPKRGYTEEAQPYLDEFYEELSELSCNVFVPMGNPALQAFTKHNKITKYRGSILPSTRLTNRTLKVIPTIHPAATIRGQYLTRYYIIFDLRRAKEECEFPELKLPEATYKIYPTHQECLVYLNSLIESGKKGKFINYDIEIVNQEVSCISFSDTPHTAITVPFHKKWTVEEEVEIWDGISRLMSLEQATLTNQNILFDAFVLAYKNSILPKAHTFHDPMVANHIMYPEFPKGLDFLTSLYTKIPYYKDEGKVWKNPGLLEQRDKEEQFYIYCAKDSDSALQCVNSLLKDIDKSGYTQQYTDTTDLYYPLLTMAIRGFKVEVGKMKEVEQIVIKEIDELQNQLDEMVEGGLNVNSPAQCASYFYDTLGIKPYMKGGSRTCDDKALTRLAKGTSNRKPRKEASLIQQIRSRKKLLSTYLTVKLDEDERLRCSWNPRGTRFGRLSSEKTLFDTGMNMQNLPPAFRRFMVADEGKILIEVDKSQAEWVVTAYVANDANMIEVIEKKLDAHARTGELISGIEQELIAKENKLISHETDAEEILRMRREHMPELFDLAKVLPPNMSIRQIGKKCNHGLNYNMGAYEFSNQTLMLKKDAEKIVEAYHDAYPGLRTNFYPGVRRQLGIDRTITNCYGDKFTLLGRYDDHLLNAAYSAIPQSTVAKVINRAIIDIYYNPYEILNELEILTQTHDSITFQYPIKDLHRLSLACELICETMDPVLSYKGRDFKIGTDIKMGFNWRDMKEMSREENSPKKIEALIGEIKRVEAS